MKVINPYKIPKKHCPLIVLSDDLRSFLGWRIRAHTAGFYSHAMELLDPHFFASQGFWSYSRIPLNRYVKPGVRLKFWRVKDITAKKRKKWVNIIERDLARPWYQKLYDWPGIIGQAIGKENFNIPQLNYCSEIVRNHADEALCMPSLPHHPAPADLNQLFKELDAFEMYGYWDADVGQK